MDIEKNLNLGEQPLAAIMAELGLTRQDLIARSTEPMTFKMVARACKGRRLTTNVKLKILNALNKCSERQFVMTDLFNYR